MRQRVYESAVLECPEVMGVPNFIGSDEIDFGIMCHVQIIDIPDRQRMRIGLGAEELGPFLLEILALIVALEVNHRSKLAAQNLADFLFFRFEEVDRLD